MQSCTAAGAFRAERISAAGAADDLVDVDDQHLPPLQRAEHGRLTGFKDLRLQQRAGDARQARRLTTPMPISHSFIDNP